MRRSIKFIKLKKRLSVFCDKIVELDGHNIKSLEKEISRSIKDKKSLKYEEGVSCPNCHDTLTNSQKERFRMRQKQINVAKKLGRKHIFQKEF